MRIKQLETVFNPVTITLETAEELETFNSIISMMDEATSSIVPDIYVTEATRLMIVKLADMLNEVNNSHGIELVDGL